MKPPQCLIFALALAVSAHAETLHYSVNWQSGLSLGEAALTSDHAPASSGSDAGYSLQLTLDAAVPGFAIRDEFKSATDARFCSEQFERSLAHGQKKSAEKDTFDQVSHTVTRTSPGAKTTAQIPNCAHDALSFIGFLRQELAQGRLPQDQAIVFGASYNIQLTFTGTETLRVGSERVDSDRVHAAIKGPKSDYAIDLFFARDTVRTPLLARIPLTLGTFTVELVR